MDSTRHAEREYARPISLLSWPARARVFACWAWRRHPRATLIAAAAAVSWGIAALVTRGH